MSGVEVACLADPSVTALDELTEVFELYRLHYGELPAPGATRAWLSDVTGTGQLTFWTARSEQTVVGLLSVHKVPASLRLAGFWQIRDLFVTVDHRRAGVARALLDAATLAAGNDGALRVSLQTEADNVAALHLYDAAGFTVVSDLLMLSRELGDTT